MERNGAVVDHGHAFGGDALAHEAGKGGSLFAVEVAFKPVADRLVQHDARPAGTEYDIHLAGRRRYRFQVSQRLAHRAVDRVLPAVGDKETLIAFTPAIAGAAGFL